MDSHTPLQFFQIFFVAGESGEEVGVVASKEAKQFVADRLKRKLKERADARRATDSTGNSHPLLSLKSVAHRA